MSVGDPAGTSELAGWLGARRDERPMAMRAEELHDVADRRDEGLSVCYCMLTGSDHADTLPA